MVIFSNIIFFLFLYIFLTVVFPYKKTLWDFVNILLTTHFFPCFVFKGILDCCQMLVILLRLMLFLYVSIYTNLILWKYWLTLQFFFVLPQLSHLLLCMIIFFLILNFILILWVRHHAIFCYFILKIYFLVFYIFYKVLL
jgi:hypothetical protein